MYNIFHLIDNVKQVNYGIWNAALINSSDLAKKGVQSYVGFPEDSDFNYPDVMSFSFKTTDELYKFIETNALEQHNTLVVSHGCWRWPTKIAHALSQKGYKWLSVPHGMLEPWSMQQKRLKKAVYYQLFEKNMLQKADVIRAVSQPEYSRLIKVFGSKVVHIPNGITPTAQPIQKSFNGPVRLLFMARLHHKKGILPLVEAWLKSPLLNDSNYQLDIAGPDDGELSALKPLLAQATNVHYQGAVYKAAKERLLLQSHIYILPSFSEGFPSSVLEAMDYGLFPLISRGCNFPEAFENDLVLEVRPDATQIAEVLTEISKWPLATIIDKGMAPKAFVAQHYTNAIVGDRLNEVLKGLLEG